MNTPPPIHDLDPVWILEVLAHAWDLPPVTLAYRPVGFGSHHWLAQDVDGERQWFVTADNLVGRPKLAARLPRALRVAWLLCHETGIDEVVAPLATRDGEVLVTIAGGRWAVALFPCLPLVDPGDGGYLTDDARNEAQRLVARIHAATDRIPAGLAPVEDFAISKRAPWRDILARMDAPWTWGPYGERARDVLRSSQGLIDAGLARYDALVADVLREGSPWVLTHGEPHAANVLSRGDGAGLAIVDWDTVAIGPRERDLWHLLSGSGTPEADLAAYFGALPPGSDAAVSDSAIALYRLRWDLWEIVYYAEWFANPHEDSEDMRSGWDDLAICLHSLARQLASG